MNHLLRDLAPLTGNEWKAVDDEAKQTLKMNLVLTTRGFYQSRRNRTEESRNQPATPNSKIYNLFNTFVPK